MIPKIFAFDLDGTLLDDNKQISSENISALEEIAQCGAAIALASGRLSRSMQQFLPQLSMNVSLVTLNGAAVYLDAARSGTLIYHQPLDIHFSQYLIGHSKEKPFALNYYLHDHLYTIDSELSQPWVNLYHSQTQTPYVYLKSFGELYSTPPLKIIFVGDSKMIDQQEKLFRDMWKPQQIYICRTWKHYLEFLNVRANKKSGLEALADSLGFRMSDVVAFGDAENDIPMLSGAGMGIAMANSSPEVKRSAARVTAFSNNENGVAVEWRKIKRELGW